MLALFLPAVLFAFVVQGGVCPVISLYLSFSLSFFCLCWVSTTIVSCVRVVPLVVSFPPPHI